MENRPHIKKDSFFANADTSFARGFVEQTLVVQ